MLTLREELTALYLGEVEPAEVVGAFRRAAVVVPLDEHGGLWTASYEGMGWIHAFCDEAALARFVMARADACGVAVRPGEAAVDYVTTLGARSIPFRGPRTPNVFEVMAIHGPWMTREASMAPVSIPGGRERRPNGTRNEYGAEGEMWKSSPSECTKTISTP